MELYRVLLLYNDVAIYNAVEREMEIYSCIYCFSDSSFGIQKNWSNSLYHSNISIFHYFREEDNEKI